MNTNKSIVITRSFDGIFAVTSPQFKTSFKRPQIDFPDKYFDLIRWNLELGNAISWIVNNIQSKIECLTYNTLEVLIRISTDMIFKVNIEKTIQLELVDYITRKAYTWYWDNQLKNLPF